MEIKLSNGDLVQMGDFCTRGMYKEIQRKSLGITEVDAKNPDKFNIDFLAMNDADDHAILLLVEKIISKDGQEVKCTKEYIDNLKITDHKKLEEYMKKVTSLKELEEGLNE